MPRKGGILIWLFAKLHLTGLLETVLAIPVIGGNSLSVSYIGTFLVFLYVWEELVRPRQRRVTNVVAMVVVLMTFLPILAAYYLTRGDDDTRGQGK